MFRLFWKAKNLGWKRHVSSVCVCVFFFCGPKMAKSKFDHSNRKCGDSSCWSHVLCLANQNFPKRFVCCFCRSDLLQENIVSSGASRFPVRHFRDQNDPHPCLGCSVVPCVFAFFLSVLGHRRLQNGHPFVETISIYDGYIVYSI